MLNTFLKWYLQILLSQCLLFQISLEILNSYFVLQQHILYSIVVLAFFKSIIKHSILNDIFIKIDTANTIIKSVIDIGSKYLTIPNTITVENIFINMFGIILYIYCLYNGTGIYFINVAFLPSLEIAVIDTYINMAKIAWLLLIPLRLVVY